MVCASHACLSQGRIFLGWLEHDLTYVDIFLRHSVSIVGCGNGGRPAKLAASLGLSLLSSAASSLLAVASCCGASLSIIGTSCAMAAAAKAAVLMRDDAREGIEP